ncbi:MAG: NfeD family protein [Arenimonas sp.]|nr:NfeD family protein [Arenimonas sp.]
MSSAEIFWGCAALLLISMELLAPGIFLLWLGFAAAGVFVLLMFGLPFVALGQAVLFTLFSFISVAVYWKYFRKAGTRSDQPMLNKKQEQLIGLVLNLETGIVNGVGRVKIGDAFWQVQGADCAQGTVVRVVAVHDAVLLVEPVN